MEENLTIYNRSDMESGMESDVLNIDGFEKDDPIFAALYLIMLLFGLFGGISALFCLKSMRRPHAETRFMMNLLVWLDLLSLIFIFLTRYHSLEYMLKLNYI